MTLAKRLNTDFKTTVIAEFPGDFSSSSGNLNRIKTDQRRIHPNHQIVSHLEIMIY
jgi:hypothetical protein